MSDIQIDWPATRERIPQLSTKDLRKYMKLARRELTRRYQGQLALKERMAAGFDGLVNVMRGVAWALACRASLREAHDHPRLGKGRASGEMWLPHELLKALRADIKEYGYSPLSAGYWSHFDAQYGRYKWAGDKLVWVPGGGQAYRARREQERFVANHGHSTIEDAMTAPPMKAVQFRIPFARREARMVTDARDIKDLGNLLPQKLGEG